ncbi:hypothetical protein [Azomonas macrocytogenes]|uniref:Uncharacterized protein n=1 Tax=Azomonas macrocytogenes TaxID=69962 RepID=A0A839T4C0_AZOMA|nr:hypothetical protein [Azomonas macrocytogenes]MBB3102563.1 hypothetical protein [Azomonas macrocytogenes]
MKRSFHTIPNMNHDLALIEITYFDEGDGETHAIAELDIVGWQVAIEDDITGAPEPVAVGWQPDAIHSAWGILNKARGTVSDGAYEWPIPLDKWVTEKLDLLRKLHTG